MTTVARDVQSILERYDINKNVSEDHWLLAWSRHAWTDRMAKGLPPLTIP